MVHGDSSRKHILVVDDNIEFCRSIERVLVKAGYQVDSTGQGSMVGHKLQHNRFDVVLLDIHIPDKAGLQLLAEIGRASPQTKTIIISVNSSMDTYAQAMALGAVAYLNKPVKMDKVLHHIELALRNSTVR